MTDLHAGYYTYVAFLKLTDNEHPRFDIPESVLAKPHAGTQYPLSTVKFRYNKAPFTFFFGSVASDDAMVDTVGEAFVFEDKFIQMGFKLPSQRIFGFGERKMDFMLEEGAYTMWSNGQVPPYDDGTGG